MHDREQSDGRVVPEKLPNKVRAAARTAEEVEERRPTKGNSTKETKDTFDFLFDESKKR